MRQEHDKEPGAGKFVIGEHFQHGGLTRSANSEKKNSRAPKKVNERLKFLKENPKRSRKPIYHSLDRFQAACSPLLSKVNFANRVKTFFNLLFLQKVLKFK